VHQKQPVANVAVSVLSTTCALISEDVIALYFFSELHAKMVQKLKPVMSVFSIIQESKKTNFSLKIWKEKPTKKF
jgi:hypothetical protein